MMVLPDSNACLENLNLPIVMISSSFSSASKSIISFVLRSSSTRRPCISGVINPAIPLRDPAHFSSAVVLPDLTGPASMQISAIGFRCAAHQHDDHELFHP